MGNPTAEDNHPPHGELPFAKYDSVYIISGKDEFGEYVGVSGVYSTKLCYEVNYDFSPIVKLYDNATYLDVEVNFTNNKDVPLEHYYLCHINHLPVDGSVLSYTADRSKIKVNHDGDFCDNWEDLEEDKGGLEDFARYVIGEKNGSDCTFNAVLLRTEQQSTIITFNDYGFMELESFINKIKTQFFATEYMEDANAKKFIAWTDNNNQTRLVIHSCRQDLPDAVPEAFASSAAGHPGNFSSPRRHCGSHTWQSANPDPALPGSNSLP
jgi:hypothetical protein